ncbi:transposase [Scopulibacillus daqui]|uniref:Transposase n=1 Tax=Scopulibacillus daqui TaxID=1469162 RepID=A0ABS2Q3Y9_9BACL|nr:transposase [Scopulibacillus daqui]
MTIIRQGSLFDLQELYDLEPTQRFEAIFSAIDIDPILTVVKKKSRLDRPVELNDAAMIYSLVAMITERIPFIKGLVKRSLKDLLQMIQSPLMPLTLKRKIRHLQRKKSLKKPPRDVVVNPRKNGNNG